MLEDRSRTEAKSTRLDVGSGEQEPCGMFQVMWSESEGQEAVERVFTGSADLNGDAVVVFMRAVCAVSQEELIPDDPSQPARCAAMPMWALRSS